MQRSTWAWSRRKRWVVVSVHAASNVIRLSTRDLYLSLMYIYYRLRRPLRIYQSGYLLRFLRFRRSCFVDAQQTKTRLLQFIVAFKVATIVRDTPKLLSFYFPHIQFYFSPTRWYFIYRYTLVGHNCTTCYVLMAHWFASIMLPRIWICISIIARGVYPTEKLYLVATPGRMRGTCQRQLPRDEVKIERHFLQLRSPGGISRIENRIRD